MGSPDALIRATVNRIGARIGHGLADTAAELVMLARNAPERLRQEWDLFQEEVRKEAERLERGDASPVASDGVEIQNPTSDTPQQVIDRLRARVAELSRRIEAGY
ncbi:hypothetical protein [Synechococcus sp. M16CYN]|uniref:hypothetical protein n=1 Tax=Synechococcus sp. M16CYN TaxID=3103139 RepID=UPI0032481F27